ncbi:MAG: aminoglycoside phosphotransferase family protein [Acetobacter sp.]|nr:aminoglycoside phosphotransferase family protein [Bacteroides sp.]MCM1341253.1 aminoglycoside phosphotransferase family protein [Acetobacter sp.]MCM1433896.1 aminoglycoside phosphotransferase family protein [Clostridiales bacterium]
MDTTVIIEYISSHTQFKVEGISLIGRGATASVYRVKTADGPYNLVVKYSSNAELLTQEYKQIKFINDRVDCKLPNLYHFGKAENGFAVMIMEYFDGVSANKLKYTRKVKRILPDMVIDNLLKIQSVHNDKYGHINNAVYDTWYDYYSEFAKEIYEYTFHLYCSKRIEKNVFKAVELSYKKLELILNKCHGKPTLIHGDYWQPNFIIDKKTYELIGVIDPFNVIWAEPEYELFQLTTGGNRKLKLYNNYKRKVSATDYCDLKTEMYALYNELLWHKKLGDVSHSYLLYRSKRLIKQMKKHKLL